MLQVRCDLNLAQESFSTQHRTELGLQDFYCDIAIVLDVVSQIDRGHATDAQLSLDVIPTGKMFTQLRYGVDQRGTVSKGS